MVRASRRAAPAPHDQGDQLSHDRVETEVLRGEDGCHSRGSEGGRIGLGDDPADDERHFADPGRPHPGQHLGHELHVRAREDRQPDEVDVLGDGGRDDLRRRQPDALVDPLEPGVAGPDGDLLRAVAVPVEPRLADEDAQPLPQLIAGGGHRGTHPSELGSPPLHADGAGDAGRGAVLPELLAQRLGLLPRRQPGAGALERRRHEVGSGDGVRPQQLDRHLGPGPAHRVPIARLRHGPRGRRPPRHGGRPAG